MARSEIDKGGDTEEQEGLLGDAGGDARLPQYVGKTDGGNQRGILEQDEPEIGKARQRDADKLRQHHQPHRLAAGQADRIAALILAARDGAESREEDLAGVGREDDAERHHAGNKSIDFDRGVGLTSRIRFCMPICAP